jgi:DNA-binding CsgD family transcriptional regulator
MPEPGFVNVRLSGVDTLFSRLVFVAGLRDPNTGEYRWPQDHQWPSPELVSRMISLIHKRTFATVLDAPFEVQHCEVNTYLSTLGSCEATIAATWLDIETYRAFVPSGSTHRERSQFFRNMRVALRLVLESAAVKADDGRPVTSVRRPNNGPPPHFGAASVCASLLCSLRCSREETLVLTSREREVLALISRGQTCKEIAGKLGSAEATVRKHRKTICSKLGLHSTAELVACAVTQSNDKCPRRAS